MLSPHPADPTLTTDNLMEVVKEVEHRWEELGDELAVPDSKLENINGLYQTDHLRMEAVVDYYVKYDPTSSWKNVGTALQEMELHQLVNNVTTSYVRGMDVNQLAVDDQPPNFINQVHFHHNKSLIHHLCCVAKLN